MHSFGAAVKQQLLMCEITRIRGRDGAPLSGMWVVPAKELRGAALLLPGTGNVGHDGDVSGPWFGQTHRGEHARLSEQLAFAMAQIGIATFRYAKRGVENRELLSQQTLPHLLGDVHAALTEVEERFPHHDRAVIGFDEGALLSMLAAPAHRLKALFLLSPLLRPIDEILEYQFLDWPVELLSRRLQWQDGRRFSMKAAARRPPHASSPLPLEGDRQPLLPLLGRPCPESCSLDEISALYRQHYARARERLLREPPYSGWYESMKALGDPASLVSQLTVPTYIYGAQEDSMSRPEWLKRDAGLFNRAPVVRVLGGVGHCFAPMAGDLGQISTSGPFCSELMDWLSVDVAHAFSHRISGLRK